MPITKLDCCTGEMTANYFGSEGGGIPVNTVEPSFAQPQTGEQATTSNGEWKGETPITYTYQWQLDGVDIAGETSNSILYLLSMAGKILTCIVKAVNAFGSSTATAKVKDSQFTWRNQFTWG